MMDLPSSPCSLTSLSDCESIAIPPAFRSKASSPAPDLPGPNNSTNSTNKTNANMNTETSDGRTASAEDAKRDRGVKNEADARKRANSRNAPATSTDPSHAQPPQPQPPAAKPKRARKRKDKDDDAPPPPPKEKKKPGRKSNTAAAAGTTAATSETTKPRRQRNSTNAKAAAANAAIAASGPGDTPPAAAPKPDSTAASRKKAKLEHVSEDRPPSTTRQTKITDLVSPTPPHPPFKQSPPATTSSSPYLQPRSTQPAHPYHAPPSSSQQHSPSTYPVRDTSYDIKPHSSPVYYPYHGSGQPDSSQSNLLRPHSPPPQPQPLPPPQRSSGQNYDPIRSTTIGSFPPSAASPPTSSLKLSHSAFSPPPNTVTPPPHVPFRASASPAITSIINPPAPVTSSSTSTPMVVVPSQSGTSDNASNSIPKSPAAQPTTTTTNTNTNTTSNSTLQQPSKTETHQAPPKEESTPMDIDNKESTLSLPINSKPAASSKKANSTSTTPAASGAQSPKQSRSKDAPPPLPGSGLLTGAMFGVDALKDSTSEAKSGPNIILHVPLNSSANRVINFAKLAEEQYGFEALHPRIAAQKARRARLAAASAALEKNEKPGSGAEEDLSADAERDSEVDGDVTMSGMGATGEDVNGAGSGDAPAKKRRRKKMEEYNREDPFIDDSEMIWEEQAAACKDGFFVYSGPLVAEGEKVNVEKADGTVKRPRGGNRRGGGAANQGGGAAGGAGASSRGRGGGAAGAQQGADGTKTTSGRGGARKPRMTKADKALMEKEKAEREKLGAGMVPGKSSGGANTSTAATSNGTK